jgi:hypothetical protein
VWQREFCNIPKEPASQGSSNYAISRVLWTNVKGEVDNFSLIGKHLLGEANFRFDIDSKAHFPLGVTGKVELKLSIPIGAITESVPRAVY